MKLKVDNLVKNFGDKKVLKEASYDFEQGRIYGLLGRNGAGKTTLFNCISNDLSIDEGGVEIETDQGTRRKLKDYEIGFVYSEPLLPEFLTGYEFLKFFLDVNKDRIEHRQSIDEYFDQVKIARDDRHRLIKGYSHGMKNKMQLLTVLIRKPPVILLDEPLTSFDVVVALEIKNLLKELKKEHIIVFSTHILQLATDLCDDLVMLHKGKIDEIDGDLLGKPEFEASIIRLLGEEENV
ncbi:MAG TPA: ABC transporter ATP-binding protein [Eubacteriaceae bacterium]|nr:ABC transporter ATP-binding protein [Eubacteriaceae bacterium]